MTCYACGGQFPADRPQGLYNTGKCRACWKKDAEKIIASADSMPRTARLLRRYLLLDVIMESTFLPVTVDQSYYNPLVVC